MTGKIPHQVLIFICVTLFYGKILAGKKQSSSTIVIHNNAEDGEEDDHSDHNHVVGIPVPVPYRVQPPSFHMPYLNPHSGLTHPLAMRGFQSAPVMSTSQPSPLTTKSAYPLPPPIPPPIPLQLPVRTPAMNHPPMLTQIPAMPSQNLVTGLGNRLSYENDLAFTPFGLSHGVAGKDTKFYNLYEPWPPAYTDAKNPGQTSNEQINLSPNEVKSVEITDQNHLPNEPGQPYQPDYYPDDAGSGQNVDQNMIYDSPSIYQDDYRNDENSRNPQGNKHLIPPLDYAQEYPNNELNSNQYVTPSQEIPSPPEPNPPNQAETGPLLEGPAPLTTEENKYGYNNNDYRPNEYGPEYYSDPSNSAEAVSTYQPTSLGPTTLSYSSAETVNPANQYENLPNEMYFINKVVSDLDKNRANEVDNGEWQLAPQTIPKPPNEYDLTGDPYLDEYLVVRPLERYPEYGSSYEGEPSQPDRFEERKSPKSRDDYLVGDDGDEPKFDRKFHRKRLNRRNLI